MDITLYGFGYVGRAVFNFLKDHYKVQVVDPIFSEGVAELEQKYPGHRFILKFEKNLDPNILVPTAHAVIAVPTPMSEDGSCDTSIVEEVLKESPHEFYLIKSTIPPGTTERLTQETGSKICFSPEYIGEGKYQVQWWKDKGYPHPTDMKMHDFQIFGGPREVTREFVNIFQKVVGPDPKMMQTNSTTAEIVKYMENGWGGMKVTFFNEWFEICQAFGQDYNEVRELFLLDGRTERMHSAVFPKARGFGGKCFPKDINAIVKAAEKAGYSADVMKEVLRSNRKFRNE